jgi:MoaA/NifB/PqqE/SkfB family radical SAM enzyme
MERLRRIAHLTEMLLQLLWVGVLKRRPRIPRTLMFFVTSRCTMHCRHCTDFDTGYTCDELSLEEIDNFAKEIGHLSTIGLGGGEPFLREDLDSICEIFMKRSGTRVFGIPTNGFSPDVICDTVIRILSKCPNVKVNVQISLDGFESTHDSIRKQGAFSKTMETADRLKQMMSQAQNLSVCFNATIHNGNYKELPDLATFVKNKFNMDLNCKILTGNPYDQNLIVPSHIELTRTLNGIYDTHHPRPLSLNVFCRFRLRVLQEHRQIIPCQAGTVVGVILANGNIHLCDNLPSVGNLREASFEAIWNCTSAVDQLNSIRKGECYCNHDCFLGESLACYWKMPLFIVMERFHQLRKRNEGSLLMEY